MRGYHLWSPCTKKFKSTVSDQERVHPIEAASIKDEKAGTETSAPAICCHHPMKTINSRLDATKSPHCARNHRDCTRVAAAPVDTSRYQYHIDDITIDLHLVDPTTGKRLSQPRISLLIDNASSLIVDRGDLSSAQAWDTFCRSYASKGERAAANAKTRR